MRSTRAEVTLAKVVLCIVVNFLICQVPRIYLQSYRVYTSCNIHHDIHQYLSYTVCCEREDEHVPSSGHAPLPPQLDVHPHSHPALLPHLQQLCQLHHLLLHGNKVSHHWDDRIIEKKIFSRFRRVLNIYVKKIFRKEFAEIPEVPETEVFFLKRLTSVLFLLENYDSLEYNT